MSPQAQAPPAEVPEVVASFDAHYELTSIPKEIVEHFAAQDKQVLLDRNHPQQHAINSAQRRTPVRFDDLPENLQKIVRSTFEDPSRHFGLLVRGDMALIEQPYAARDFFRGESLSKQLAMEDASDASEETLRDHMRTRLAEMGYGSNRGFVRVDSKNSSKTRVRDQVIGGRQLLQKITGDEPSGDRRR